MSLFPRQPEPRFWCPHGRADSYWCEECRATPKDLGSDSGPEMVKREVRVVEGTGVGLPTEDKARKRMQMWTFLMEYFPDTFLAVLEVAIVGNEQHNPGEPLHWAREKSKDQMNTAFRHQWDYGRGVKKDTDGQWHLAKAIWRLSAQLQLDIEEERRAANGT